MRTNVSERLHYQVNEIVCTRGLVHRSLLDIEENFADFLLRVNEDVYYELLAEVKDKQTPADREELALYVWGLCGESPRKFLEEWMPEYPYKPMPENIKRKMNEVLSKRDGQCIYRADKNEGDCSFTILSDGELIIDAKAGYESIEIDTLKKGGCKPLSDEEVEGLLRILNQIKNNRVAKKLQNERK